MIREKPGCSGKATFATRAEAKVNADRVSKVKGHRLRAYKCLACGWFHTSSLMGPREDGRQQQARALARRG